MTTPLKPVSESDRRDLSAMLKTRNGDCIPSEDDYLLYNAAMILGVGHCSDDEVRVLREALSRCPWRSDL